MVTAIPDPPLHSRRYLQAVTLGLVNTLSAVDTLTFPHISSPVCMQWLMLFISSYFPTATYRSATRKRRKEREREKAREGKRDRVCVSWNKNHYFPTHPLTNLLTFLPLLLPFQLLFPNWVDRSRTILKLQTIGSPTYFASVLLMCIYVTTSTQAIWQLSYMKPRLNEVNHRAEQNKRATHSDKKVSSLVRDDRRDVKVQSISFRRGHSLLPIYSGLSRPTHSTYS